MVMVKNNFLKKKGIKGTQSVLLLLDCITKYSFLYIAGCLAGRVAVVVLRECQSLRKWSDQTAARAAAHCMVKSTISLNCT
jgi:hypothetical protein